VITWEAIDGRWNEEFPDFRTRAVAVFREFEGQETDETDRYGRTVKVTMASFARHFGINKTTFSHWCGAWENRSTVDPIYSETTRCHRHRPSIEGKLLGTSGVQELVENALKQQFREKEHDLTFVRNGLLKFRKLVRRHELDELDYYISKLLKEIEDELPERMEAAR